MRTAPPASADQPSQNEARLQTKPFAQGRIVRMSGEHDLTSATALCESIEAALPFGDVIVDLNEVTFIDSSVLHAIVHGSRVAWSNGCRYMLCLRPDHSLQRVLEIAGLDRILPVVPDIDAARARLANGDAGHRQTDATG